MPRTPTAAQLDAWQAANRDYLGAELDRLRLRLARLVLWVRAEGQSDTVNGYRERLITDAQADRLLAGDVESRRAEFYRQDRDAQGVDQRLARVERDIQRAGRAMTRALGPPALDRLQSMFSLTAFERDVLLLGIAPEIDAGLAGVYGYAQDDATRRYPTGALALALFAEQPADVAAARNALGASGTLRRLRLISLDTEATHGPVVLAPLRVEERIADYVRGVNAIDPQVAALLRPVASERLSSAHRALVRRLEPWVGGHPGGPLVNLVGSEDHGTRGVARGLCDRLGWRLAELDLPRLATLSPGERAALLPLLDREAALLRLAFYLSWRSASPAEADVVVAREVAERLRTPLLVVSAERWRGDRTSLAAKVPRATTRAQRELWRAAIAHDGPLADAQLERLIQQFDFGARDIGQAVAAATQRATLRGDVRPSLDDLWATAREQAGCRLDDLAQRLDPVHGWKDLVLPRSVAAQLEEIAAQVQHRGRVYDGWGFGARLSRGRGITALFSGPSGTGKTMAAEVLANQLGLDLWSIDLAGVVSKYIGETERNLRRVFDAAERGGVFLFFDEADALFGKRTEVKDSHDRYANIEVNYLLQRMETYRGLAVLASNRKASMDRAFLRRLRFLVDFPFPNVDSRRQIWRQVFPPEAELEALDYEQLARIELPGGSIKNIAVNAAFLAAGEGHPIGMPHIVAAAARECAKLDKAVGPDELGPFYDLARA
jgi:hypothetical protein